MDISATQQPTIVNPPTLHDPTPFGYSTAVIAPAGVRIAHISGQAGQDEWGAWPADFATQVDRAYVNLGCALTGIGAEPSQVVKLTIFVIDHDMTKLAVLTRAVTALFGEALPAQTLVPVPRLALDGMMFEVDATVALT